MLKHLSISNYVLIENLDVDLNSGMTVITGETGAGKSIVLGALSLLLGNRAESKILTDQTKKCIVEGVFVIDKNRDHDFFTSNDIDFDAETYIRREVTPEGRSRAFINDTPVKLNVLKDLTSRLIDIHSQHQNLTLKNSTFRLQVVDSFHGDEKLLKNYRSVFQKYTLLDQTLKKLKLEQDKLKRDEDYFSFQFNELNNSDLESIDQVKLESDLQLLENSGDIIQSLQSIQQNMDGDDPNLLGLLIQIESQVNQISKHHPSLKELHHRIQSLKIELSDISDSLNDLSGQFSTDPEKQLQIQGLLDNIYILYQKHRVNTAQELILLRDELDEKLNNIGSVEGQIESLTKEFHQYEKEIRSISQQLTDTRMASVPGIEKKINGLLSFVGMNQASFKVEIKTDDESGYHVNGSDKVTFMFSPNKGRGYNELDKIASGGELSRLMLCIKAMLADTKGMPTLIFDEIDSGISGEVANKVGEVVKNISGSRQVIVISHLPQMAGKADHHFSIYKETSVSGTNTKLKILEKEERIVEIARMLSGENPSDAARETAADFLGV